MSVHAVHEASTALLTQLTLPTILTLPNTLLTLPNTLRYLLYSFVGTHAGRGRLTLTLTLTLPLGTYAGRGRLTLTLTLTLTLGTHAGRGRLTLTLPLALPLGTHAGRGRPRCRGRRAKMGRGRRAGRGPGTTLYYFVLTSCPPCCHELLSVMLTPYLPRYSTSRHRSRPLTSMRFGPSTSLRLASD